MENLFEYKTINFSIIDENGEKSTISVQKWAAELLIKNMEDAHKWIQDTYNRAVKYNMDRGLRLTRRKIGDLVRKKAYREASTYEEIDF